MDNPKQKEKRELHGWSKIEAWLEKRWVAYSFATCSAVVLFLMLSHLDMVFVGIGKLYQFVAPVLCGVIIAYLINPVVNFFEQNIFRRVKKAKKRHNCSVVSALCFIILLIALLLSTLIPSLVDSFMGIAENMETYAVVAASYAENIAKVAARFHIDLSNLAAYWDRIFETLMSNLPENADTIVNTSYNIGTGAVNLVLGFILAVYFLFDKERLIHGINRLHRLLFKDKSFERSRAFWQRCHMILGRYIAFDLLDGIIVGAVNAVFMLIAGMPYVALISVIVGVTNLLPTFGPIIGAVIGGIILVLTSPIYALIFLIFTVVLQIFDGYILKPKMFGGSLGVPEVWILVTIVVGGKMFGIVGILLAIPFAAIFTFVYEESIIPWLERRKQSRG